MKPSPKILALIAMMTTPAFAQSTASSVQMEEQCVKQIQSGVEMMVDGASDYDDKGNPTTVDPEQYSKILIDNVKVVKSSCLGPADCDAQHPDAFDYVANITYKDMGVAGKVKVFYHRGNCTIEKLALNRTK